MRARRILFRPQRGTDQRLTQTVFPLWAGALGLSFIPLIAACYQTNYYLGTQQNAYDNKDTKGNLTNETGHKVTPRKGVWGKIMRIWDQ